VQQSILCTYLANRAAFIAARFTIALAMTDAMRGTLIIPPRKGTEK